MPTLDSAILLLGVLRRNTNMFRVKVEEGVNWPRNCVLLTSESVHTTLGLSLLGLLCKMGP